MKLHAVTMIRDEADVIEAFVRHTLCYVDELHVVLHQSLDSTETILDALKQEGLNVRVRTSSESTFRQGATLTTLARQALHAGADFVFVIDADEFLRVPSRQALEHVLSSLPEGATGGIPWQIYVPLPSDNSEDPNILTRVTHRPSQESKPLGKLILGRDFLHDESLFLLEGAHWVYQRYGEEYVPKPIQVFADLRLAHFPVRSAGQAVSKLLQRRWQRRIAWVDEPITKLVASGWRSTFDRMTEMVLARGTLTRDELFWFAFAYNDDYRPDEAPLCSAYEHLLVRDPCANPAGEVRYAAKQSAPFLALYRWIDSLVAEGRGHLQAPDGSATAMQLKVDITHVPSFQTKFSSYKKP